MVTCRSLVTKKNQFKRKLAGIQRSFTGVHSGLLMGQINIQFLSPPPQKRQDELKIETVQVQRSACVQVQTGKLGLSILMRFQPGT